MAKSKKNRIAESVTEFLEHVFEFKNINEGTRCYRGEGDSSWRLMPSIMRGVRSGAENQILSELLLEAPNEFDSDKSMFDKLVRAQHYGLPTRLLDVSLNPLVGLYFACYETDQRENDGTVRVFDFNPKRVKYADSDAISLICNLARLSDSEREEISSERDKHPIKTANAKNSFRKIKAIERLMQFVRVGKPYFLNTIEPYDLFRYYFVFPTKNNKRVIAQSGAFIAAGLLTYRSPSSSNAMEIKNIIIPNYSKEKIIRELDLININSRTLFPEIEFASKYIKQKWSE